MYYFCTYFDSNYLTKGLALYRSLIRHCSSFKLWVLCMDTLSQTILVRMALPHLHLIPLEELERDDAPLRGAKRDRSRIEYYFTCTPSLALHILNRWPDVDMVTYLDADLFFFGPPEPIYNEMGANSIMIIGHRFPPSLRYLEKYGIYNVGWLSFRKDEPGLRCLQWWRARCIEWCYDRVEHDRFADQKYLDQWPTRFPGVKVLQHKGAELAPWNMANYTLSLNAGHVMVDGDPLIFFHFQGLQQINARMYDPGLLKYWARLPSLAKRDLYIPYIHELHDITHTISPFAEGLDIQCHSIRYQQASLRQLMGKVLGWVSVVKSWSQGDLLFLDD